MPLLPRASPQRSEPSRPPSVAGWFPQTVTKVEQGSRSLKLVEGLELARILGVEPTRLYAPATTGTDDQRALRAVSDLRASSEALRRQFWELQVAEREVVHLSLRGPASPQVAELASRALDEHSARASLRALTEQVDHLPDHVGPSDDADMAAQEEIDLDRMK